MGFFGLLQEVVNGRVTTEDVVAAMDNHAMVIINYMSDGQDKHTGTRVIEPVAYGVTSSGNPVIRAFQPYGDSTTKYKGWKLFRLDRITYWEETKAKFNKIPEFNGERLNADGDDTMATVIKTFRSTMSSDASSAAFTGPKTKDDVARTLRGDDIVSTGRRNLDLQSSGVRIDLDNNRKVGTAFNAYTANTPEKTMGPKEGGASWNPSRGRVVNPSGIDPESLKKAREQVYGDYMHDYSQAEKDRADFDAKVMNRQLWQNKDLSTSSRSYERQNAWRTAADSRALSRKGSWNRDLSDMDDERRG